MSADESTWGVQPTGFVCPTQQEIIENISDKLRGYVDPKIDLDADSPEGQKLGIITRQLALAWETLRALYVSRSRDGAEDDALVEIGKLTGTSRGIARGTTVWCSCELIEATTLVAGETLASVTDKPDVTLTPVETFTAPESNTYSVLFVVTETGPINISANTVRVIQTPITGWISVNNVADGVLGSDVATDAEYRLAQELDLTQAGSGTAEALAAELVLDAASGTGVPGVLAAEVLVNDTDQWNSEGIPPHSIEVLILDDGTVDEPTLAEAIYRGKSATAGTHGERGASFVDDSGVTRTVRYSNKVAVPIYITYDLTTTTGYVGDPSLKSAVVQELSTALARSLVVPFYLVAGLPFRSSGVTGVPICRLGTSPSPMGTSDLTVSSARYIPTFSTDRVVIL